MSLHLLSPKGFRAAGVRAGIKASGKPDVALLVADRAVPAAAVFTTNQVCAAPVEVGRDHIRSGKLHAIVVNSGNANACTGKQGLRDARDMCNITASLLNTDATLVLPSSTGVIGHPLPMPKVRAGIHDAFNQLGNTEAHAVAFRDAIMTTDAFPKTAARTIRIGRSDITLAGVVKGAGMIGPRLALPKASSQSSSGASKKLHATMLAYLTTDADIAPAQLRRLLAASVHSSFNACLVDDHTSTNDTVALLASGASNQKLSADAHAKKFADALADLCTELSKLVVSDGEGATKVVVIRITGAKNDSDAALIARAIANSNLVKCAMHGNDPNWGRIVSAAGLTRAKFDPNRATLLLQGHRLFKSGTPLPFSPAEVSNSLKTREVDIHLACGLGSGESILYTCDLTREYIRINADYTT